MISRQYQPQISRQSRWKVQARLAILEYMTAHGLKGAAEHFGPDRKTVREWRDRAKTDGVAGLVPRYPARRRRRIPATTVTLIEQARRANSKRQPELATFKETVKGQTNHLRISTAFRMEPGLDRLSLAFFADLAVPEPSGQEAAFRFSVTEMGRMEEAQLAIQLVLSPGELLETGKTKAVLGHDRLELGAGRRRRPHLASRLEPKVRLPRLTRLASLPSQPVCECLRDLAEFGHGRADRAHHASGGGRAVPQAGYPVRARGDEIVIFLAHVLLVVRRRLRQDDRP